MPDREKVIKGLECHAEVNCVECPYRDGWRTCPFGETLLADALDLLKEQEYKDRMFHALEDDWKALLKEQEEKPLRCKTCTMRDKTGFCHRWNIEVKDDDYCSFGAWKGCYI